MSPYKISIVTISFNQSEFLEECIKSVVNQDYENLEYIIVDPGSTDGSREIIEKYKKKINHLCLKSDSGPAEGLNNGFKLATGEIFGFLNADDKLEPGSLKKISNFFNDNNNIDILVGNSWIIDKDGKKLRKFYSDKADLNFFKYSECIISQASTFFKSECYNNIDGFNNNNSIAWDTELYVDMALKNFVFKNTKDLLSQFRIHPDGITGSGKEKAKRIEYNKYIYTKITKKRITSFYFFLKNYFKYLRKLINFKDTLERIFKGPIYNRFPKN